jgi:unsaturated rhamnogalacturonyl hydrolase
MKTMILFLLGFLNSLLSQGQDQSLSKKMAVTVMEIWKDSMAVKVNKPAQWTYEQGVVLEGFACLWRNTADARYFSYIKKSMDFFVSPDGSIRRYKQDEYNIDNLKNGRSVLFLYKVTNDLKYYKAAKLLREQLKSHPRTSEGGFWHKRIYPDQMWLDGLYMAEPFYAEYAATFNEPEAFDDIAKQFILMEQHSRDLKTGLLYHGWDETKKQKWADSLTGHSPHFWGRAMGWYAMALTDVLDYFPKSHPQYDTLLAIFNRLAIAVRKIQDSQTGLWYQVLDKPEGKGNYLEASASCMFVYAFAKGVRKEYLPETYLVTAQKAYEGIKKEFIERNGEDKINLKGTVSVAGLGGNPYRDGSYGYYISEKVVSNDPKGIGAFLMAANEMEIIPMVSTGKGKKVLLDNYFNHETKTDSSGIVFPHHYVWNEDNQNGFSFFGHVFNKYGVRTIQSEICPSSDLLKNADIYIIVDPDSKKENVNPNYIEEKHIRTISDWVKSGGVLLLFANDSSHVEFKHFNQLAAVFGIHFNDERRNMVKGREYETGAIHIPSGHSIFPDIKKVYMKELCTISVVPPAKASLIEGKDIIMTTARWGKGIVFAVGDPWLYNEYMDGRKISSEEYQNYKAAEDLVKWTINQLPEKPIIK